MMIKRAIQPLIEQHLFKGKIVILYGARQVGKTTLAKEILAQYPDDSVYLNCDEPDIRDAFSDKTSARMKDFIGKRKLAVLDEAQRVTNIGPALKLLHDSYPDIQLLATGSSSFELSDKIAEPLTGRKLEFHLFPFSVRELLQLYSEADIRRLLDRRLVYGMYPEIVSAEGSPDELLKSLARSYAYKDVLKYQQIRNHEVLEKLLQALALQIGAQVSYTELAQLTGVDKETVAGYIQILEKAFIVFRLRAFSGNARNELKKSRKIYFYDVGIRNALINNLNGLELRQDTGALWENFVIAERLKFLSNSGLDKASFFWRTRQKQEIDYIETDAAGMTAVEIKWGKPARRAPKAFTDAYPRAAFTSINKDNFLEFVR